MLRPATSLGLFRDDSGLAIVEIPYAVETRVSVSDRFLLKPLLPMLHTDRPYVALRLSRGEVRAYRGGRSTIHEIEIPGMPGALEDVTKFDDPEKSLQQHTSKTISAKGRPGTTTAIVQHGQGLAADMEDQQFDRFFRSVAHALDSFLSKEDIPLVVFGVEENLGYLRNVHDWSTRTLHTRAVDASEWSADQVRAEAWQLLEPEREDEKAGYLERIGAAANKGELLTGIKDCALAAATGRIELAVIAEGIDLEGVCDLANMEVKTVEEADLSRSHDLPDFIATETLRHGGQVLVLPAEEIPGHSDAVALARF